MAHLCTHAMTLIVSMRIPDGIVLAGDSLSTLLRGTEVQGDLDIKCPRCGHDHVATAKLQGAALPATSLSFAQKIFPFFDSFGIGTSGAAQLGGKTIYFAMRELEQEIRKSPTTAHPASVSDVAKLIGDRALQLLHADAQNLGLTPVSWTG